MRSAATTNGTSYRSARENGSSQWKRGLAICGYCAAATLRSGMTPHVITRSANAPSIVQLPGLRPADVAE